MRTPGWCKCGSSVPKLSPRPPIWPSHEPGARSAWPMIPRGDSGFTVGITLPSKELLAEMVGKDGSMKRDLEGSGDGSKWMEGSFDSWLLVSVSSCPGGMISGAIESSEMCLSWSLMKELLLGVRKLSGPKSRKSTENGSDVRSMTMGIAWRGDGVWYSEWGGTKQWIYTCRSGSANCNW